MDGYIIHHVFGIKIFCNFKLLTMIFGYSSSKVTCVKPIENFDNSNTKQEVAFVEPSFGC